MKESVRVILNIQNLFWTIMFTLVTSTFLTVSNNDKSIAVIISQQNSVSPIIKVELDRKYNVSEAILLTDRVLRLEEKLATHKEKDKH